MKKNLNKLSLTIRSLAVISFALIAFSSCKKEEIKPSFDGTYYGSISSGIFNESDTITVSSDNNSSDIVMDSKTGSGSSYTIMGTVNDYNLTIASMQVYIPSLNAYYTVSGTGTFSETTLNIHYTFVSPTNSTSYWSFFGTKH